MIAWKENEASLRLTTTTTRARLCTATYNFADDKLSILTDNFNTHLAGHSGCQSAGDSHGDDGKGGPHDG